MRLLVNWILRKYPYRKKKLDMIQFQRGYSKLKRWYLRLLRIHYIRKNLHLDSRPPCFSTLLRIAHHSKIWKQIAPRIKPLHAPLTCGIYIAFLRAKRSIAILTYHFPTEFVLDDTSPTSASNEVPSISTLSRGPRASPKREENIRLWHSSQKK